MFVRRARLSFFPESGFLLLLPKWATIHPSHVELSCGSRVKRL
jgi:hypothetical protein